MNRLTQMSSDNQQNEQIIHCLHQMERFSHQLAENMIDSKIKRIERIMQFGFNFGRFMVLGKENVLKNEHDRQLKIILLGFPQIDPLVEVHIYSYGYALGYLQEYFHESHEKWWKPIPLLIEQEKWTEISELGKQNIAGRYDNKTTKMNWNAMKEYTLKKENEHNIESAPVEFLNKM